MRHNLVIWREGDLELLMEPCQNDLSFNLDCTETVPSHQVFYTYIVYLTMAKFFPMQMRCPAPKGKHTNGLGLQEYIIIIIES